MKLNDDQDPFFSSTIIQSDEKIDLWELGFTFAIENIDASLGTIYAQHVTWGLNQDRSQRVETPITLVDCKELLPGGAYENQSNSQIIDYANIYKGRRQASFLCPTDIDQLYVQGNFGSDIFEYVKIAVKPCVEGNCVAKEDFPDAGTSIVMTKAQPDIFSKDRETVINYSTEISDYYAIDPLTRQILTMYFYQAEINLRDFFYDIFQL